MGSDINVGIYHTNMHTQIYTNIYYVYIGKTRNLPLSTVQFYHSRYNGFLEQVTSWSRTSTRSWTTSPLLITNRTGYIVWFQSQNEKESLLHNLRASLMYTRHSLSEKNHVDFSLELEILSVELSFFFSMFQVTYVISLYQLTNLFSVPFNLYLKKGDRGLSGIKHLRR